MSHKVVSVDCRHCLQVNNVQYEPRVVPQTSIPHSPSAFAHQRHKLLQASMKGKPLNTLSQARRALVSLHCDSHIIMYTLRTFYVYRIQATVFSLQYSVDKSFFIINVIQQGYSPPNIIFNSKLFCVGFVHKYHRHSLV